ncbi:MAG: hypothetical protein ABSH53_21115 [Holophaga sp.]|jgi:hypothetical protein
MNIPNRTEFLTRDTILNLLSDDEVARVSTAEAAVNLAVGDEFLDLEHLERGVLKAGRVPPAMGGVLPRKAVHEKTWAKILKQLKAFKDKMAAK